MYAAGGKLAVINKIKVSYTEATEEKERLNRITEILSEGVYVYLKKSGFLREDLERRERIKGLLEKTKKVGTQTEEEIEREDSS